jgi:hypothetical protein
MAATDFGLNGMSASRVRRRRFPAGARPARPNAPAGSNRSSHGGNEMAEDERGGNRHAHPNATAPHLDSTDSGHIFVSGSKATSAGPPRPAEILPGTTIHIALRMQGLRTRVFRGIELENHPLRVRNARIRGRVQ